jgi:predicted RNase H-like HicB family nuclease
MPIHPHARGCPNDADQSRWFGGRAAVRALARKETLRARGGTFQAVFRRATDGGYVVLLPAIPHLMTRGASYQHARVKALALVHAYLRELRAGDRPAGAGPQQPPAEALPLAA